MSASLVGSEMCIRDRVINQLFLGSAFREGSDLQKYDPNFPSANHRLSACLLYTSDAADDM
eukprot:138225-Alexandrium_andersonii.AAC.1